ncbi:MAG TPA: Fe-S cluster assembly protein SufD [Rhodobacteraceae bacterium]|nr:Fe-S cluster assembly protein SufD [Paracoccaceae bacterium]
MQDARKSAAKRLEAMGLPQRRDEYWKYTRPDLLTAEKPAAAAIFKHGEGPMFAAIDRLKIVFVDGVYDADLSDDLTLQGVKIWQLCDAPDWAQESYGKLEETGQSPVPRPLATLNTAHATEGVVIHATGESCKPISLIYQRKSETSDVMMHHIIKLDEGVSLTVLENGAAAARLNTVVEIDVADRAAFHHIRTMGRDHGRVAATHMFARLGAESTFKSFTMTMNGKLTRNEVVMELTGDNATAHVAGVAMGDGEFVHDDTVFITHDAVNCESRQVYKKVLRNGATGVFQGKILVQPDAQKTDGYQMSQSLLLDDNSQYYGKPELEIYADDVLCSHGSTTGAIDDEAMFYLRSRGVEVNEAQDLLILAFLAAAVDEIESEEIADHIRDRLASWLTRRRK